MTSLQKNVVHYLCPPKNESKQVEASLEALNGVGNVVVTRATNTDGFTWNVTFATCRGNGVSGVDVCNTGDVELITFEDASGSPLGSLSGCSGNGPSTLRTVVVEGSAEEAVDMVDLSDGPPFR